MVKKNSGVEIGGNSAVYGGVIGGEKATVIGSVTTAATAAPGTTEQLHAALLALACQIRESGLTDREELAEVTETIAGQATADAPNKTLVKSLLDTVKTGVAGVTALTGLVSGIDEAAKTVLGIH